MKSYKEFIRESKRDIHSICDEYGINDYTINPDGSIDVDGNIILSYDFERGELTNIPLKFAKIIGDFECDRNQLTTLKGSPTSVGGGFDCSGNKLISLEYCPESVGGNFDCHSNELTSLEYCPEIGRDLNCRRNQITDFKGVPEFFEGLFYCEGNPIEEIYTLFLQENYVDDSKCIKWINEFDVIQGDTVIMDRLEEVFHQLGMVIPQSVVNIGLKNLTFKNYKII
jgi:hypothetical protein